MIPPETEAAFRTALAVVCTHEMDLKPFVRNFRVLLFIYEITPAFFYISVAVRRIYFGIFPVFLYSQRLCVFLLVYYSACLLTAQAASLNYITLRILHYRTCFVIECFAVGYVDFPEISCFDIVAYKEILAYFKILFRSPVYLIRNIFRYVFGNFPVQLRFVIQLVHSRKIPWCIVFYFKQFKSFRFYCIKIYIYIRIYTLLFRRLRLYCKFPCIYLFRQHIAYVICPARLCRNIFSPGCLHHVCYARLFLTEPEAYGIVFKGYFLFFAAFF